MVSVGLVFGVLWAYSPLSIKFITEGLEQPPNHADYSSVP